MGAKLLLSDIDKALKQQYISSVVKELLYDGSPLLALIPKFEGWAGREAHPIVFRTSAPQGRGTSVQYAIDNKTSSSYNEFSIKVVKNYAVATIDNMVLQSSKKPYAIESALREFELALRALKLDINRQLYKDGTGALGQAASVSTNVITLSNSELTHQFEVGMTILGNPDLTGVGTPRTAKLITDVDYDAGTITLESSHGIQASDYLFINGDRSGYAGGISGCTRIAGLAAWFPVVKTDSSVFFGVDRTSNKNLLFGKVYAASNGTPISEVLKQALGASVKLFGAPDLCILPHSKFMDLIDSMGDKVIYNDVKPSDAPLVGFSAVKIIMPGSKVLNVVSDPDCPDNRAYLLKKDTLQLVSIGQMVKIFDTDGVSSLREISDDAITGRWYSYAQLVCDLPGVNTVISFS